MANVKVKYFKVKSRGAVKSLFEYYEVKYR